MYVNAGGWQIDIALTPCGAYIVDILPSNSAEVTAAIRYAYLSACGWINNLNQRLFSLQCLSVPAFLSYDGNASPNDYYLWLYSDKFHRVATGVF